MRLLFWNKLGGKFFVFFKLIKIKIKKLVAVVSSLSRKKEENLLLFSCAVGRWQSWGCSSAKTFIDCGVEFFGWRGISDAIVTVFGFGGGNRFLDFSLFLLIHLSVDTAFRGAPSAFCLSTLALGLTDFRCVPRCIGLTDFRCVPRCVGLTNYTCVPRCIGLTDFRCVPKSIGLTDFRCVPRYIGLTDSRCVPRCIGLTDFRCLPRCIGLTDFRCVPRCIGAVWQELCGGGCMLI